MKRKPKMKRVYYCPARDELYLIGRLSTFLEGSMLLGQLETGNWLVILPEYTFYIGRFD